MASTEIPSETSPLLNTQTSVSVTSESDAVVNAGNVLVVGAFHRVPSEVSERSIPRCRGDHLGLFDVRYIICTHIRL
jgi:hypothetical protein